MIELPYKLHGTLRRWRSPWILGIISLIVYKIFHLDFFHFYIYFFIAGIITIYIEWPGWGELSNDGLLIRYGLLNRYKLFLRWHEIKMVKTVYKTINYVPVCAWGAMYDKKGYDISYIGIELKNQPNEYKVKPFKRFRFKMLFGQTIDFIDNNTLILDTEPDCGTKKFYDIISEFLPIEKDSDICDSLKYEKNRSLNIYDLLLFLAPVALMAIEL